MEITTTTKKKGRINLFADGEYQFTVSALFWAIHGCPEGGRLPPEALSALAEAAKKEAAFERALRLISLRAHGETELYRKLRRDFEPLYARSAVDRCRDVGLVDDEAYARLYAEELFRRKGYAPERIELALREKGIDKEIAKNAAFALDIDRKIGIIRIIEKMRLPETVSKQEASRLLRRLRAAGYSMREIREVVEFSGAAEELPEA